MSLKHLIAASLIAFGGALFGTETRADVVVFDFTAECDDCAGTGTLTPWNSENMNDGLFQTVFGRLTLFDYTPGTMTDTVGEFGTPTEFEFSYFGSTLVDPFTVTSGPGVLLFGGLFEDGSILDLGFFYHIAILWGSGSNLEINGRTGTWLLNVDGCCSPPNDVGISAQFALASVPSPGAVALLGVGLLGLRMNRRTA